MIEKREMAHSNSNVNMSILQGDILEDQYYMTFEFQRSNQQILKLSEHQHELYSEREELEKEILGKQGQGDEALWQRIHVVRAELDTLYDEKLMLVKKMFNLGQKFVQELEV